MLGTNPIRANRYSRPGRIEQVRYYREQGSKEGLNSDVRQRTPDKRTMLGGWDTIYVETILS